ncbi:RHS repeat-associated core domain-containing protein [Streptomyces castrisilvae]|uniref:RHS repeat-associated core domain-containing protein n=1 Tax=Streptomyces castrisilvae TaxID=3033811 RepID=A0ABY9HSC1_9ACTN|nr:RHS repeat-associated core domain-containing protein [Streptomyces sp. Mut1]WLQ36898.1 RHS repeat-associated core domain-containing protein [Streptomyces sp. Mut1]
MGGIDDTSITGLIHLGGREYDPEVGRFLSADPLLNLTKPQSLNGYSYAENNAVTFSDPTGQASTCSSNCGGELLFKESHAAPDFNTGETWEEKYPWETSNYDYYAEDGMYWAIDPSGLYTFRP